MRSKPASKAEQGNGDDEDRQSDRRSGRQSWLGEAADRALGGIVSRSDQTSHHNDGGGQNRRADAKSGEDTPHRATIVANCPHGPA
jgi:hypothetical protein